MTKLNFDNRLIAELPGDPDPRNRVRQVHGAAWSAVQPTPVAAPRLLAHAPALAARLGFDESAVASQSFLDAFSGNGLLPGMQPFANNYGGHQFGHWAGQLGDGRAISLGELVNEHGERWELQLKGAGPTPYSRSADGRAVLRSSLREFICSEAMHRLGVPTTRALTLVGSGEEVVRDILYSGDPRPEPGAIVCRVAPSFLRFGSFELPASRGETELLAQMVRFCIARDFPELTASEPAVQMVQWFNTICERTATLMAHWMRVGFVHGVMNTDNMSILGLTIDYGPYGWVEDYDPAWTPNTTDAEGRRYCFGRQPQIAHWNLSCLAGAIAPLLEDHEPLRDGLQRYAERFNAEYLRMSAGKLGLGNLEDISLYSTLLSLLQRTELDFTLFFRRLGALAIDELRAERFAEISYSELSLMRHADEFNRWLADYGQRIATEGMTDGERRQRMGEFNPLYVPRNWLAQQAIDAAERGDLQPLHDLVAVLDDPYSEQPESQGYAALRPEWARHRPGCSMLSCSS